MAKDCVHRQRRRSKHGHVFLAAFLGEFGSGFSRVGGTQAIVVASHQSPQRATRMLRAHCSAPRHLWLLGVLVPFSCILVTLLSGVVDSRSHLLIEPSTADQPLVSNLLRRALHLTVALTPALTVAPIAAVVPPARAVLLYPAILHAARSSGALLIKWGQWAATRPDLLPRELCDSLASLHAGAPEHSFDVTRAEVELALGGVPLESYFEAFERAPIASGSIGQVHAAVWQGQRVAVKVRHPGVALELQTDLALLRACRSGARTPDLGDERRSCCSRARAPSRDSCSRRRWRRCRGSAGSTSRRRSRSSKARSRRR